MGKDLDPEHLPASQPEERFFDEPIPPDAEGQDVDMEVDISQERLEMAGIMRELLADPGYMALYCDEENDLRIEMFRLNAITTPETVLRVTLGKWQFMAERLLTMRRFVAGTDKMIEDNLRLKQTKGKEADAPAPE